MPSITFAPQQHSMICPISTGKNKQAGIVVVEHGSLISFGGPVNRITERVSQSLWQSLKSLFFTSGSPMQHRFTAKGANGWVQLQGKPKLFSFALQPSQELFITKGALIARDASLQCSDKVPAITKQSITNVDGAILNLSNKTNSIAQTILSSSKGKNIQEMQITKEDGPVFVATRNVIGYTHLHGDKLSCESLEIQGWINWFFPFTFPSHKKNAKEVLQTPVTLFEGKGTLFISAG